jgi:hypothetical protein
MHDTRTLLDGVKVGNAFADVGTACANSIDGFNAMLVNV